MRLNKTKIERVRARPQELLDPQKLSNLYRSAALAGMSLSNYLEKVVDPSEGWGGDDGKVDAWTRLCEASPVVWRSEPENGIWADSFEDIFTNDETRGLIPEFTNRVWKKARTTGHLPQVRFLVSEDDETLGSALRPYMTAAVQIRREMEPLFALSEIVALTTPVDGTSYQRVYLEDPDPDQVRMHRIGEAADIPRANIRTSEKAVRLFKYGKGMQLSYEALRNAPIDKVGFFVARVALQTEQDRIVHGLSTLINGDGTPSTAAEVIPIANLDADATDLTYEAWLGFKAQFRAPYTLTHVFARTDEGVKLQMLSHPNTTTLFQGSDWAQAIGAGSVQRINDIYGGVVRLGETNVVPASSLLGIDARYALERLTEIGSTVQETTNFIENQTRLLVFTETEGFDILDENAAKILDFS